ncbi:MAG: hypothetical protein FRX49_08108 [Trebouxia sp. A1-2]|nr:MAG: hypothetical protein FRX49_08108 [Trebouxia sp. A1-2]
MAKPKAAFDSVLKLSTPNNAAALAWCLPLADHTFILCLRRHRGGVNDTHGTHGVPKLVGHRGRGMRGDGPGTVVSAIKGVLHAHTVLPGPRPVRPGPTPGLIPEEEEITVKAGKLDVTAQG